ncbi:hypothetical protein S7335_4277 [Synechococcus sp. PCC 7335]|uniref:DUF4327 family protein n=1 Tax=Synechococcus sp. (strain ATCC 29403 / PCC 7335) TaxID=91464 RepID=UPI00017ED8C0|nr:DUF4327 family protein [Synechococcus sp. PCC 7335]EDX86572.1 hypothetical protein S7335_4277 [Synechococcus sp. PCC 7335]
MLQTCRPHSIHSIQDEVRALVDRGSIGRTAQLYSLARFFGDRDWHLVEEVLEDNEYLLRDYVCDLIGHESWQND